MIMRESEQLKKVLLRSVEKIPKEKVCVPFSGGIDSALMAFLVSKKTDVQLYVCGSEGSHDPDAARSAAKMLNLPLKTIIITKKDVEEAVPMVAKIINSVKITDEMKKSILPPPHANPVSISFNLPLYFVAKNCKEKVMISSQGPDTMFGGYASHLRMSKEELQKELEKNTEDLILVGQKQHKAIGKYFNKKVLLPYTTKEILNFALDLDVEHKIKDGKRKAILVETAKQLGLPREIAEREKKSAQYGSGIMSLMKNVAKENRMGVGEWVKSL